MSVDIWKLVVVAGNRCTPVMCRCVEFCIFPFLGHTNSLMLLGCCCCCCCCCSQVGQWLNLDVEVHYCSSSSSSNDKGTAGPQEPLLLQISLYVTDMSGAITTGEAGDAAAAGSSSTYQPGMAAAAAVGPKAAAAVPNSNLGRLGSSVAAAAAAVGAGPIGASQVLIDPGVFVAGCYNSFRVLVQPGMKAMQRLQVLLVQPGLYQFGVLEVCSVHGTGSSSNGQSGHGSSSSSQSKVYFNQDKLYVFASY
jgi:hypothetical protein